MSTDDVGVIYMGDTSDEGGEVVGGWFQVQNGKGADRPTPAATSFGAPLSRTPATTTSCSTASFQGLGCGMRTLIGGIGIVFRFSVQGNGVAIIKARSTRMLGSDLPPACAFAQRTQVSSLVCGLGMSAG